MRLIPRKALAAIERVDPGKVRDGVPVGLRDGAILALVAAGLSAGEIARLQAKAFRMRRGRLILARPGDGLIWYAALPDAISARIVLWLSECRLWDQPEPVFKGARGPLSARGVSKVFNLYAGGRR